MSWNDEYDKEHEPLQLDIEDVDALKPMQETANSVEEKREEGADEVSSKGSTDVLEMESENVEAGTTEQPKKTTYQQYNQPKPRKDISFAISSLVIGIISFSGVCCFGGVLGIIGLVLGIISLKKKEDAKAFSIVGIVLSVCSLIITILAIFVGVLMGLSNAVLSGEPPYSDDYGEVQEMSEDVFAGKRLEGDNSSVLSFDEDGNFTYHVNEDKDGKFSGYYMWYQGDDARDYLEDEGITEEWETYLEKSDEEEEFSGLTDTTAEDFYCLELKVEKAVMDKKVTHNREKIVFFGYLKNDIFDVRNNLDFGENYFWIRDQSAS